MLLICFIDLRNNSKEFAHSISFHFSFYSCSYTTPNLAYCITQRTPKFVVCYSSCSYLFARFPFSLAILHGFNFRFILLYFGRQLSKLSWIRMQRWTMGAEPTDNHPILGYNIKPNTHNDAIDKQKLWKNNTSPFCQIFVISFNFAQWTLRH